MSSLEGGAIPPGLIVDSSGNGLITQAATTSSQDFLQSPSGAIANPGIENSANLSAHTEPEEGDAQDRLKSFWQRQLEDIQNMPTNEFKTQELPLARIKKIMKMDEDVKMISAEAPLLFSKAAQIFIHELSLRAWVHTEESKRRTLQRNDIATAITKFDQFDFLIDIVPREELKPVKRTFTPGSASTSSDNQPFYYSVPQQQQSTAVAAASNTNANIGQAVLQTGGVQSGQLLLAQQGQNGQPVTLMPVNIDGAQLLQLAQPQPQQQSIQVAQAAPPAQQASTVILNTVPSAAGSQIIIQTQPTQQQAQQPQQTIIQNVQVNVQKQQQQQQQQQQNVQAILQQLIGNQASSDVHSLQVNSQGQLQLVKVAQPQQGTPVVSGQQISMGQGQILNIDASSIQAAGTNINTMYVNVED